MKFIIQTIIKYIFDLVAFPILFLVALLLRFFNKNKGNRVLIGLTPNNNFIYLRNSLSKLHYAVKVIPWIIPRHEQGVIDYDLDIASMYPKLYKNFFGQLLLIYGFFFWSLCKFDIFIVPFRNRLLDRTGFLTWFELQLLHLAGKKVILNPYGGDIQFPEVWNTSENKEFKELYAAWNNDPYYSNVPSLQTRKNTHYCQKHADALIVSIDWPDYLENGNCYYLHMRCVPESINTFSNSKYNEENNLFTIVHATNHPHFKGTQHLEDAVSDINKNGKICELIILKNTKNLDVLNAIQNADVVFDQLLLGAYGRLAIEAMSLGKPVICYLREDLKKLYKNWGESNIVEASMDSIKEKLLELMGMSAEERKEIGKKSISYVKKYHSAEYVGGKLHEIIQKVLENDSK